jgi:hypothetical protein
VGAVRRDGVGPELKDPTSEHRIVADAGHHGESGPAPFVEVPVGPELRLEDQAGDALVGGPTPQRDGFVRSGHDQPGREACRGRNGESVGQNEMTSIVTPAGGTSTSSSSQSTRHVRAASASSQIALTSS